MLFLHRVPPSVYKSSRPLVVSWGRWVGISPWGIRRTRSPCSEIKQPFLSTNLASFWLLSREQPDPTFGNTLSHPAASHPCSFRLSPPRLPSSPLEGPTSTCQCAMLCPPESSLPRTSICAPSTMPCTVVPKPSAPPGHPPPDSSTFLEGNPLSCVPTLCRLLASYPGLLTMGPGCTNFLNSLPIPTQLPAHAPAIGAVIFFRELDLTHEFRSLLALKSADL